jgi:hypothetical protein
VGKTLSRRCRDDRDRDRVGGVSDRNRDRDRHCRKNDRDGQVGGEQDFCRRVRRCLEDDRVGGVEDRNHRRNRCWWW